MVLFTLEMVGPSWEVKQLQITVSMGSLILTTPCTLTRIDPSPVPYFCLPGAPSLGARGCNPLSSNLPLRLSMSHLLKPPKRPFGSDNFYLNSSRMSALLPPFSSTIVEL